MVRLGFVAVLVLSLACAAGPAAAQGGEQLSEADQEARVHFRLGNAYYESGRFADAAREFEEAYRFSNRPALLYNVFVAHRDGGNLLPAIQALRGYLRLVPDAEDREQLTARLAAMERMYRQQQGHDAPDAQPGQATSSDPNAQASETESSTPEETHATTATEPASSATTSTPTHADTAGGGGTWMPGWSMAGVGGAAVIAGVITGVMALDAQSQLSQMCDASGACDPGFEGTRDSGAALAGATDGLLIGGGVLAAAGVVLALVLGGGEESATTAAVGCTQNGCSGVVRGRF